MSAAPNPTPSGTSGGTPPGGHPAARQFLCEASGKLSAARLLLLLWGLGVLAVWLFVSIPARRLAEVPESVVTILGLLLGGKVVQRFGEK